MKGRFWREAKALVPALISFLVVLSYEKKGEEAIVDVSKIRGFAEQLAASNQHPTDIGTLLIVPRV